MECKMNEESHVFLKTLSTCHLCEMIKNNLWYRHITVIPCEALQKEEQDVNDDDPNFNVEMDDKNI